MTRAISILAFAASLLTAAPLPQHDRPKKVQTSKEPTPPGHPGSADTLIAAFEAQREETLEIVRTAQSDLHAHSTQNPLLGKMDAYEWILFACSRSERHYLQMKEVMADPACSKG